jgi:hypothetical protein
MTIAILIGAVVLVAIVAGYAMLRRPAVPVAPAPRAPLDDGVVGEPTPIVREAPEPTPRITWARQFAPAEGALDDDARLKLIHDLGMLRAPWAAALLQQAVAEEPSAVHREAAARALTHYRETGVV